MYDELSAKARQGLSEYLQRYPWSFWFTSTSKNKDNIRYPTVAIKRAYQSLCETRRGFVGAERHYLGGWHTHGLVYSPSQYGAQDGIKSYLETSLSRIGFCRVENIHNQAAVAEYVSKYITKDLNSEWLIWGIESWDPRHRLTTDDILKVNGDLT